jgi:hypothetical protein
MRSRNSYKQTGSRDEHITLHGCLLMLVKLSFSQLFTNR